MSDEERRGQIRPHTPCADDGTRRVPDTVRRIPSRRRPWKSARRSRRLIAQCVLGAITLSLVVPVVAIFGYLLVKAWPVLGLSFLLENPKDYMTAGGIWAPLVGTFFLVLISLLAAAPIGILAGVYLNEYARDNWATRIINLAVMNLAGVPSIVHALFGVGAFVLFAGMGRSLLAASCTLAVMTLPVIITSTREALAAVPMSFREACWNMGATRWQTIRTIVLPNSISGILTGVILQVSRAAGETAPILFTGAVFFTPVRRPRLGVVLPLRTARPLHGPVDAPVHAGHAGPRRLRRNPLRHGGGADRPGAGGQQRFRSVCGAICGRGRNGEPPTTACGFATSHDPTMTIHIRFENVTVTYGAEDGAAATSRWKSPRSRSSPSSARPTPARRRC